MGLKKFGINRDFFVKELTSFVIFNILVIVLLHNVDRINE